ncbi:MAG TPA: hypothetical protein VJS44_09720 [Pyrinomonadaceae bacterium]|nr:hypothetical protein [Pyrinomonadaceae bacterium]
MSKTKADDAEKYTLMYYTVDDREEANPPFKYRTYYLADALEGAWRNHQSGGNAISIVQEQRIVLSNEELNAAFARISELIPLTPERPLREIAEQVVSETGKA